MPAHSKYIRFEEGWPVLQEAVNQVRDIVDGVRTQKFTSDDYMRYYTTAYNMCRPGSPEIPMLYDKYKKTFEDYISSVVLPSLREKKDESLLRELVKRWNNHKVMTRWLSRFSDFLDRYSIPGRKIPSLRAVSYLTFYDLVYGEMNVRVRDSVIYLINREREGEQIDQVLVDDVLGIYMEMGEGSTKYYEKDFEEAMLKDTTTFYSQKASIWMISESFKDYMVKVEAFLKQERDRVSRYLQSITKPKLEVVEHELLSLFARKLEEKKQLVISHVSEHPNMPPHKYIKFEEGWPVLQEAVNEVINIVEGVRTQQFTSDDYMRYYTTVYNMCPPGSPESPKLYDKYKKTFEDYVSSVVLPSLREKKDESLLRELVKRWNNHEVMTRRLSKLFNYVERFFIPIRKLPALRAVSLLTFYELVYSEMNVHVRDSVISLIDRERKGEQIDQVLVKNVLGIYMEMGEGSTKYYEMDFEEAMLKDTTTFYSQKASIWINISKSIFYDHQTSEKDFEEAMLKDHAVKVEACLKQEMDRVSHYLQSITGPKLEDILFEVVEHELLPGFAVAGKLEEKKQLDQL